MPEQRPPAKPVTPLKTALDNKQRESDAFPCDRCGAEMYRMHAVWRCPSCGFKSDCCGW